MDVSLLRAVRIVIHADAHPIRQAYFEGFRSASRSIRLAAFVHARVKHSMLGAACLMAYGLGALARLAPPRPSPGPWILALAVHSNAQRFSDDVAGAVGVPTQHLWSARSTRLRDTIGLFRMIRAGRWRRPLAWLGKVQRTQTFLVSCRLARVVVCYSAARHLLRATRPTAVLVSSDSNPEEVALIEAARQVGIPSIFVAHAYATPVSPPLSTDLALLEGEAAAAIRQRSVAARGVVALIGLPGASQPMVASRVRAEAPTIGLCLPKVVSAPVLATVIEDCLTTFNPKAVLVRWHPSDPKPCDVHGMAHGDPRVISTATGAPIGDMVRQCDWIVADVNSNVHLDALKLGVPTVAVDGIGPVQEQHTDMYRFVANRLIPPAVRRLREIDAERLAVFYSGDWAHRFARYDATYMAAPQERTTRIATAVAQLIDQCSAASGSPAA